VREYSAQATGREQANLPIAEPLLPHLIMPAHHEVRSDDVIARRLHGNLAAAPLLDRLAEAAERIK
jgi:uncharacterized protein